MKASPSPSASASITADSPFFSGHFPGRPVLPGLALLAMLAAGAVVVYTAVLFALGAEELTEARALFRRRAR